MNAASFYPLFLRSAQCVIDSRKVQPNDLFFAFSGEHFNAAEQAADAIAKGALAAIVEQEKYADPEQNIFYVPSTLLFLQELARYHRSQIKIPVIGLTGSNGKTTTKELIHAVLSQKYHTQYTSGNLNNHIGVPLTILSIRAEHEMAVVEMGANHQKEIELLCSIAQPDYGYITNFGKAHLEGFGGFEGVIKGKSELYQFLIAHGKTILVNESDPIQVEKTVGYQPRISFGQPDSDYFFEAFSNDHHVGLVYGMEHAQSHLTGGYNFTNLCAAASFGFHFGLSFPEIKTAIEAYLPTNMRSQVIEKNGKTLVLDTYNANPSSMAESLKNFSQFEGSKTIIIGDMLELGAESRQEHQAILDLAKELGFTQMITVGKNFAEVNKTSEAFEDSGALALFLQQHPLTSKNILLKASRGIALEKVLDVI